MYSLAVDSVDDAVPKILLDAGRPSRSTTNGDHASTGSRGFSAEAWWPRDGHRKQFAEVGDVVIVGDVRLDNASDIDSRLGERGVSSEAADLDRVAHLITLYGTDSIRWLLGDFAFVLWDRSSRNLVVARDAFGVKPLYYATSGSRHLFVSALTRQLVGENYDREYVADFLAKSGSTDRTVWSGVYPVKPGHWMRIAQGRLIETTFWSACDFEPSPIEPEPSEAIDEFRELFGQSIVARCDPTDTWSHLAGVDSSSIVALTETLAAKGRLASRLKGTVTLVDDVSSGNDARLGVITASHFGLRHLPVHACGAWDDWQCSASEAMMHGPTAQYPFTARHETMWELLDAAGARVVLSGTGSDECFSGYLCFLLDWMVNGRPLKALRELAQWCKAVRYSFVRAVARQLVLPILPVPFQLRFSKFESLPSWVRPDFAREVALSDRFFLARQHKLPMGHKYSASVAMALAEMSQFLERHRRSERIELRYPFLSRPLVEFVLKLHPLMRTRAPWSKWILRQSMDGILTDAVRLRVTKDEISPLIVGAIVRHQAYLDDMFRNPVLGDLGCIEPVKVRTAIDNILKLTQAEMSSLFLVLALETWMSRRRMSHTRALVT